MRETPKIRGVSRKILVMRLTVYTSDEHAIRLDSIDEHALSAVLTLQDAGHTAYLVGGSVRDLLLGKKPKDFDISTSARPEEIKKLFQRQCLLIGRRFRLAHLRFGQKILEVATFRAGDISSSSLIVHDNRWGSEEEDVLRRDFTMNALFYDPRKQVILDYVGGVKDIEKRLLRTIGKAHIRFKQDPVRMIRLLKFQARFGFRCDEEAIHAMHSCRHEILKSAEARVLEELLKMLESGRAEAFFSLMTEYGFINLLLPCFHHFLSNQETKDLANSYLRAADEIVLPPKRFCDRATLLSALIFPILEREVATLCEDRQTLLTLRDILQLADSLLQGVCTSSFVHFPKKLLGSVFLTVTNQFRMTPLKGDPKYHARFSSKEDFLLSLDFLRLRCLVNPNLGHFLEHWEKVAPKE